MTREQKLSVEEGRRRIFFVCRGSNHVVSRRERDSGIVGHVLTEYLGSPPGLRFHRMTGISRDTDHMLWF